MTESTTRLAEAIAVARPDLASPLIDRVKPARIGGDSGLWRLRLRWRERGESRSADLVARIPPGTYEAEALRAASSAGIRVPGLFGSSPDVVLLRWLEGESFAAAWRRRAAYATAELLADLLADIHDAGLTHGAFGPEMVLLDRRGGATVVGWRDAGRGDPVADLAIAVAALDEDGPVLRTPFLRLYRQRRSVSPDDLARASPARSGEPSRQPPRGSRPPASGR